MASSRVYLSQLGTYIGNVFTPANPYSISAVVKTVGGTTIESPTPVNESTGWYYVELADELYTSATVYIATWSVVMVQGFPTSTLTTRFYYNAEATINRVLVQNVFLKIRSAPVKLFTNPSYTLVARTDYYGSNLVVGTSLYVDVRSKRYKLYSGEGYRLKLRSA